MKNPKLTLIIPLLLLSTLAAIPTTLPRLNAQLTGTVCLEEPGATDCSMTPVFFASVGNQLMVEVRIQGSDPLNGFDIQLKTDPTVLQAADASLAGSILGTSFTILVKCLDGSLVEGATCAPQDGPGVLHFAAVRLGGLSAGNGLLFTAVYDVVAVTSLISLDYQTGCSGTSVAPDVCVTIADGSTAPLTENVQGATFSNLTDFGIGAVPASHTLAPSAVGTSAVTLTSFGGFTDFVDIQLFPSAGLVADIDGVGTFTTLFLPADGTATGTLSVSAATTGSYSVLVVGTAVTNPAITHSVTVSVTVTLPDFIVTASPTTLAIPPGGSDTSTITVASIAGFTATITLAATVTPAGPTAALSPFSVFLAANGMATSTLTVTVPGGTAAGTYTVDVTGTGSGSHTATVTVIVGEGDFSINAVPDSLSIPRFDPTNSGVSSINLASINSFAATLTLSASIAGPVPQTPDDVPGAPPSVSLSKTTSILSSGGSDSATLSILVTKATAGTGLATITITATGGGKTHTVQLSVYVIDFLIKFADPVVTIINTPGTLVQTQMTLIAVGAPNVTVNPGFDGALAVPNVPGYTYPSAAGRIFDQLPDTATTKGRCYMRVFDAGGTLILPTIAADGHVTSFAAPLVHVNGDLDGDPPDFDGCRFDSGFGPSFFGGGPWPGNPDFPRATMEILPGTPNGSYTALICMQSGLLINCASFQINVVQAPPGVPAFSQFNWKDHRISLSRDSTQTFTAGVSNPAGNPTLYVQIEVTAVSSDGMTTLTALSAVVAVAPGHRTNNIVFDMDLSEVSAGVEFSFSASIHWSLSPFFSSNVVSTQTIGTADKPIGGFITLP